MSLDPGLIVACCGALALLLSLAVCAYLVSPRARLRWLDEPNERSLHQRAVPRTGGLAILAGGAAGGLLAGAMLELPPWWYGLLLAAFMVALVSLLDDWRGLGVLPRLATQLLAATLLLASGLLPASIHLVDQAWFAPAWLMFPLALLFVVWMSNLYNFMDGMDGFAGGMSLLGFSCMALLGWIAGDTLFAAVCAAMALAAAGFLAFNFPPARIFMGDVGASTLGLLAAAAMLWAEVAQIFPLWIGLLIFSPFIVDASFTLCLRALSGERIWQPHRRHCYQRLVRAGWSHRRTVLAEYALMLLAGATALLYMLGWTALSAWAVITAWLLLYVILIAMVHVLTGRACSSET